MQGTNFHSQDDNLAETSDDQHFDDDYSDLQEDMTIVDVFEVNPHDTQRIRNRVRSHPVKGRETSLCLFKDPIPTETKKRKLHEMSNVDMIS